MRRQIQQEGLRRIHRLVRRVLGRELWFPNMGELRLRLLVRRSTIRQRLNPSRYTISDNIRVDVPLFLPLVRVLRLDLQIHHLNRILLHKLFHWVSALVVGQRLGYGCFGVL